MAAREDYIKHYDSLRQRAILASRVVVLFGLTFWAISRSPDFTLSFGAFKDGITSGYVVVFGPWILFGLAFWYHMEVTNCLGFRDLIRKAVNNGELGAATSFSAIEEALLTPPHIATPRFGSSRISWFRNVLGPHLTLCTAIFCLGTLLGEYFRFHTEDNKQSWPYDILWGSPFAKPISSPKWNHVGSGHSLPWVYPPWFTLLYIGILMGMVYFLFVSIANYNGLGRDPMKDTRPAPGKMLHCLHTLHRWPVLTFFVVVTVLFSLIMAFAAVSI